MDHEPWCPDGAAGCTERTDRTERTEQIERTERDAQADADPASLAAGALDAGPGLVPAGGVDWLTALAELDDCDGYVVLAVDPQTGEVDAHGPYPGMGALRAAEQMRETLDREELEDVVVRVVRWHGA